VKKEGPSKKKHTMRMTQKDKKDQKKREQKKGTKKEEKASLSKRDIFSVSYSSTSIIPYYDSYI